MTTLEEVFLRLGEEEEISSLKTEVCSETILLVDEEAQEREEDEHDGRGVEIFIQAHHGRLLNNRS